MGLVEHAKKELELAGLFDKDSDYDGMLGHATVRLIEQFAKEGHSGFSAGYSRFLFSKLANFENLTPITDNPEDWMDISDMQGSKPGWQCKRNCALFSEDGGKTYHSVSENRKKFLWFKLPQKTYKSKHCEPTNKK